MRLLWILGLSIATVLHFCCFGGPEREASVNCTFPKRNCTTLLLLRTTRAWGFTPAFLKVGRIAPPFSNPVHRGPFQKNISTPPFFEHFLSVIFFFGFVAPGKFRNQCQYSHIEPCTAHNSRSYPTLSRRDTIQAIFFLFFFVIFWFRHSSGCFLVEFSLFFQCLP